MAPVLSGPPLADKRRVPRRMYPSWEQVDEKVRLKRHFRDQCKEAA
jgi:hypothetical protein